MAIFMALLGTANIQITPEVLTLIAQIDEFKGARRALGSLAQERLLGPHQTVCHPCFLAGSLSRSRVRNAV